MSDPEVRVREDGLILVDWGHVRFSTNAKGARKLILALMQALQIADIKTPEGTIGGFTQ